LRFSFYARRRYSERRTRWPRCGKPKFRHDRPPIERIIAQADRRVLRGEAVPANEKIVSLFESDADIIVKGGREGSIRPPFPDPHGRGTGY